MYNMKCDILSLDIWDTILRRNCHPDEIKLKAAQYLYLRYKSKIISNYHSIKTIFRLRQSIESDLGKALKLHNKDDEYELKNVLRELIQKLFITANTNIDNIVHDLYEYELTQELENIYLDPGITEFIDNIEYNKLVLISDFYAGKEFISKLLKKVNFNKNIYNIYISCEYGVNKRSGNLYKLVKEDLDISYQNQIHIGDNPYSDVEVAKRLGITALNYLPQEEHSKRMRNEHSFNNIINTNNINITPNLDISNFFYGFISNLIESCINNEIYKVYFFTREGEFYKNVYDAIKSIYPKHLVPKSEILEVSRLATFTASLREVSINEMMRIWNQYSIQSMKSLFKSLDIHIDKVAQYLHKYNIPEDEIIVYPWMDKRIIDLFEDVDFKSLIEEEIKTKKQLLMMYCKQKQIENIKNEKIAIVDIGWRGTIQDNLCYIFNNIKIVGFYVGLIDFLNPQPANSEKYGYINGYRFDKAILTVSTPFEMICNSPNGSTKGYQDIEGNIIALKKNEITEDNIFFEYTKNIQKRIIADCINISTYTNHKYFTSNDYKNISYKALRNFIFYPSRKCAVEYFRLKHNEEFGVGKYIDKATSLKLWLMFTSIFSKKKRKEFKKFLINTTWPQGYLTKYYLYPLLKIYNKILEKYY